MLAYDACIRRRTYTCTKNSGRYEEAFVPEPCRQIPRRPTVVVPSFQQPIMVSAFSFVATTLLSMHHASCNRSIGAPVLHHTACNPLQCNRQRANFKNVRCSQQACLPRKCTPHTAPQVNDYPMPMTPIAATAREMQANPPLEQTSQIASPEAG